MKSKLVQQISLLFCFKKGDSFVQSLASLRGVFGDLCMTEKNCKLWWDRFTAGQRTFDNIEDKKRSGRPRSG